MTSFLHRHTQITDDGWLATKKSLCCTVYESNQSSGENDVSCENSCFDRFYVSDKAILLQIKTFWEHYVHVCPHLYGSK